MWHCNLATHLYLRDLWDLPWDLCTSSRNNYGKIMALISWSLDLKQSSEFFNAFMEFTMLHGHLLSCQDIPLIGKTACNMYPVQWRESKLCCCWLLLKKRSLKMVLEELQILYCYQKILEDIKTKSGISSAYAVVPTRLHPRYSLLEHCCLRSDLGTALITF